MPLYGGIDLHANNSLIALLDHHDKVVYENWMPNELATILTHLAPYHARGEKVPGTLLLRLSEWPGPRHYGRRTALGAASMANKRAWEAGSAAT